MRGIVSDIEVATPASLTEALAILANPATSDLRPLAGGTDLMVVLNAGMMPTKRFLNVQALPELKRLSVGPGGAEIGAGVTYTRLLREAGIVEEYPNLAEASRWVGGAQIQNRGTVGGNIVNASPAADAVPALMAYDAVVVLASAAGGKRQVPLSEFYEGYKKMKLAKGELLVSVMLPPPPSGASHYFRKVGTRLAQAISKVVLAGVIRKNATGAIDHVAISIGSVAPTTLRLSAVEDFLIGKNLEDDGVVDEAVALFDAAIAPIDDIRSTAEYRRFAARNCFRQFLAEGECIALADFASPLG
jgi:CO/xanthine dehydrogenase FAD-binding subunit